MERLIARIRARAAQRLWRTLARNITPAQRYRLDALLISDDGRPSALDRLRDGPYLRSGAELYRAVERLDEVRLLTAGLPETSHVPPGRVAALARFATVAKAQAVARMPEERRMATLLAFVHILEATAQDDVLDLLDIEKRGPSGAGPLAFVPSGWKRQERAPDGAIDKVAYRICLLEGMRSAIRRRDLFAAPSLRYADARLGLLSGPAWEAARPAICRTLGLSTDAPAEIARLSAALAVALTLSGERTEQRRKEQEKEVSQINVAISGVSYNIEILLHVVSDFIIPHFRKRKAILKSYKKWLRRFRPRTIRLLGKSAPNCNL